MSRFRRQMQLIAIGDALGLYVEFKFDSVAQRAEKLQRELDRARWMPVSDDTQLSLYFLAHAQTDQNWLAALQEWFLDPRNTIDRAPGTACSDTAQASFTGLSAAELSELMHDSFGSGAVMRTPILADFPIEYALDSGLITHAHRLSAPAIIFTYFLTRSGGNPHLASQQAREYIASEHPAYQRPLLDFFAELPNRSGRYGNFTALGVVRDVVSTLDVVNIAGLNQREALIHAVLHGGDADTVGAVTGGILGYSQEWDGSCDELWERIEPHYHDLIEKL